MRCPSSGTIVMCTQPVDSGTSVSDQVAPRSVLTATAAVSWLPVQRTPGRPLQRKSGSNHAPSSRTTTRARTKLPSGSPSGRPGPERACVAATSSGRRMTSHSSWRPPPGWAVWNSQTARLSGSGKMTGFCSERAGSSETWADGLHRSAPGVRVAARMKMSGLPSSVPANHAQASVPSGSHCRNAAWFCTTGEGRYASARPGSTASIRPSMRAAISSGVIGILPLRSRFLRWTIARMLSS